MTLNNGSRRQSLPVPETEDTATPWPANEVQMTPAAGSEDPCKCPTPLILDPDTGQWLHLATMRPCPVRLDAATTPRW